MPGSSQSAGRPENSSQETCAFPSASDVDEATYQRLIAAGIPLEAFPKSQNLVATANLCCRLDLVYISQHVRNVEFRPRRFRAVVCRIRRPVRATALIFHTGKMVLTGVKTEAESRLAGRKIARILMKLGFATKFEEYKVQNVVASTGVGFMIRIERLALKHNPFACFEPEIFPGCVYEMQELKMKLIIFVTGKVIFTGAKSMMKVYRAWELIYPVLQRKNSLFTKISNALAMLMLRQHSDLRDDDQVKSMGRLERNTTMVASPYFGRVHNDILTTWSYGLALDISAQWFSHVKSIAVIVVVSDDFPVHRIVQASIQDLGNQVIRANEEVDEPGTVSVADPFQRGGERAGVSQTTSKRRNGQRCDMSMPWEIVGIRVCAGSIW